MPADAAPILDALPQTQCTRCGFADCAGYADALAQSTARINQCPPGGAEGIERLSAVTGSLVTALNPENGLESARAVAIIDEDWCIGCTLCIEACPTDAIFGSNRLMHTVMEPYCTGCELCIPVCPVDCISLENVSGVATGWAAWSQAQADSSRARYVFKRHRRSREERENELRLGRRALAKLADLPGQSQHADPKALDSKTEVIAAAILRARARRVSSGGGHE